MAVAVDHHLYPCLLILPQAWITLSFRRHQLVGKEYSVAFQVQSVFGGKEGGWPFSINIATYRSHRCNVLELVDYFDASNISCMEYVVRSLQ